MSGLFTGNGATNTSLSPKPWHWRNPSMIPPRPWLLGNVLLRGYTTLLGAAGGTGKTAWAVGAALAVILGQRSITGLHSFVTGNVWYITLEDDRIELERRFAAAILCHGLDETMIESHLFINGGPLKLAEYVATGMGRGAVIRPTITADAADVEEFIRQNGIMLTVLDPLVKAHALDGNRNEDMDEFMRIANDLARVTNSAILLPAHFRKGAGEDHGQDAFRGASSLIDGARLAFLLLPMSPEEAAEAGINDDDRSAYIRMINAKANMTPKAGAHDWLELRGIDLGNTSIDPAYPAGDSVQAMVPWQPPDLFAGLDPTILAAIFSAWEQEIQPGVFYSPTRQSKQWGGVEIMKHGGKTSRQAFAIMKKWEENGVFDRESYREPNGRNAVLRIVVNQAKAAAMTSSAKSAYV